MVLIVVSAIVVAIVMVKKKTPKKKEPEVKSTETTKEEEIVEDIEEPIKEAEQPSPEEKKSCRGDDAKGCPCGYVGPNERKYHLPFGLGGAMIGACAHLKDQKCACAPKNSPT